MENILNRMRGSHGQNISKGFLIWMFIGLIIFIAFVGGFTILSRDYICNIDFESSVKKTDQFNLLDGTLAMTQNEAQIYFHLDKDIDVNYLDIDIKDMSVSTINARLYYADTEDEFDVKDSNLIYLNKGFNEIKVCIGAKKYFRLDIWGGNLDFNAITLCSAANPRYQIPKDFLLFILLWNVFYVAMTKYGIRYTGMRDGILTILEGMFAVFIIIIMLFATGMVEYSSTVLILVPLVVFAFATAYSKIRLDSILIKKILPIVLIGMVVIMCIVGYKMLSTLLSDLGTIYYSAWEIATEGKVNTAYTGQEAHHWFFEDSNNGYFVRYHNNIPLLAIFAVYYKVLSVFGLGSADLMSNYMSVLLNIVFIMAAVIFGMFTAKNLFGKKGMFFYLVMSALFAPYYINACRYYTDTMSMPFVTLALWIYTIDDGKFKLPYMKYMLMGIVLGIGSLVKGNIPIIAVAIFIHLLLKNIKNIRFALVTVILVVAINGMWSIYIRNCSWIDMSNNDELQFPLTHFIMMGIDSRVNGGYSQEDFIYTDQYTSKAEKQRANIEKIKQRIVNFGSLSELCDYELTKAAGTWFDGQYMQDEHISWGIKKSRLYDFILVGREYNDLFKIYIQVFTFCMHIFGLAGVLLSIKKPKADYAMFIRLIMFGAILFFIIWESKSRYILNLTPVFMLAAIYGAEEIKVKFFTNGKLLDS